MDMINSVAQLADGAKTKRIEALDFGRIGRMIKVGEDEIRAVVEVETGNGSGFDSKGRLKMLFEPHVFYRELGEVKRATAVNKGLAYRKWGEKPYPSDSYPKMQEAMKLDRAAALRSASWGLGQIMGGNHKAAGFQTIDEMLVAFMRDEDQQLQAMVNFIITNSLDDDLREHNWATFARGYNGPGYKKHGYDTRLAVAFSKWQKRADSI
jgi:hypothetical protein